MLDSIIQTEKACYICGNTIDLHSHHIFYGQKNHKWSEKYGLKVWLCPPHHNMSNAGVHLNKALDTEIKQIAQRKFEETHTREEFMKIFGRNYL